MKKHPTKEYSPEKIKELLSESLEAVSYWQQECLKNEARIQRLEKDLRLLKESQNVVRLPFGGFIK